MAAAETHPPVSFTMHTVDEYKLFFSPFVHFFRPLGSFNPFLRAQFEFYFDNKFFKLFMFPPISLESRQKC